MSGEAGIIISAFFGFILQVCLILGIFQICRMIITRRKQKNHVRQKRNNICCRLFGFPRPRNKKPKLKHRRVIKKRIGFEGLLHCVSCLFFNGCVGFDFTSKISISNAVSRYSEFLDEQELNGTNIFTKLKEDSMLAVLLEILNYKASNFFFKVLPTGSLREGFGKFKPSTSILATDYDLMLIPDGVAVEEDENRDHNSKTPILFRTVTNTNEIPPGYLWLKLSSDKVKQWNDLCFERLSQDGGSSICSESLIGFVASLSYDADDIIVDVKRNGPALNVLVKGIDKRKCKSNVEEDLFDADFTFGLYCPKLPRIVHRRLENLKTSKWPDLDIIKKIESLGCHVVPKASQHRLTIVNEEQPIDTHLTSSSALEFRYSYSQAELLLADIVPPVYRRCYMAFKALVKFNINNSLDRNSETAWGEFHEVPSYVLKTTLFWMISELGPFAFDEHQQGECLLKMVERLAEYIDKNFCPLFWNEQVNLLDGLSDDDFRFIEEKLLVIRANGIDSLKTFLVDDWLEFQRCMRLNCCKGLLREDKYSQFELDMTPCPCQKKIEFSYEEGGGCGPMLFDESAMGVY